MKNIKEKIKTKKASVLTASEFKALVRKGNTPKIDEVDVITCGTFGVMSGTSAILSFQAAEPGSFTRAVSVSFNGIDANIGPCPNERNGHIDCIVFGTSVSHTDCRYGGGHLFRDLASGKTILTKITTDTGIIEKNIKLADMSCARLIVSRGAFKNYSAFANTDSKPVNTIFSVIPMPENLSAATFSGCGEINPLENDKNLRYHKAGKQILVNGAKGIILGTGTRSSMGKPNLSFAADICGMNPYIMGGFSYPNGAECLTSIATAIPVEDAETISALSILDENIPLPIVDTVSRTQLDAANYADAWSGDKRVKVNPEKKCRNCITCASKLCPMHAITPDKIITEQCMGCFTCVSVCPSGIFSAETGKLHSKNNGDIPIILRQSDKVRAEYAAELMKKEILLGKWEYI